jgi:hypothetical protein
MAQLTYKYPLLNNLNLALGDTTNVIGMGTNSSFILNPGAGDTLMAMEFTYKKGKLTDPSKLKITLTQGKVTYDYITDSFNIKWEGLGIPVGLSNDPLQVLCSHSVSDVKFTLSKLQNNKVLKAGSRYLTKKLYWTINDGVASFTEESAVKSILLDHKFEVVGNGTIYCILKSNDMDTVTRNIRPQYVVISGDTITVPADKKTEMDLWFDKNRINRPNWTVTASKGRLIESRIDQMMQTTEAVKKFSERYGISINITNALK